MARRAAPAWRRVAAMALDLLLVWLYIGLLLLIMLTVGRALTLAITAPWQAHLLGFGALTLPVILYFALFEHLEGATFGKRWLGLRVLGFRGGWAPLRCALLRNAIKFVPWELAHTAIYYVAGWPQAPAPLALWQEALFYLSLGLAALYIVMLFVGGRTLYDRLSETHVVRAQVE